MFLGQKLKEARQRLHMTQRQLAGDQIQRSLISQLENNSATPSVSTLCTLSERLGLPVTYFIENKHERLYVNNVVRQATQLCTKQRFHEAIDILIAALPFIGDYHLKWNVLQRTSQYCIVQNKLREAVVYLQLALSFAEPHDIPRRINGLLQLAHIHIALYQFKRAEEILHKVQNILKTHRDVTPAYTLYATERTGKLFLIMEQYSVAETTLLQCLHHAQTLHIPIVIATTHQALATLYKQCEQFTSALHHGNIAMQYFREMECEAHMASSVMNIGDVYLEKGKITKAVDYYKKAYTVVKTSAQIKPLICQRIALAYVQLQQFTTAAQWAKKGISIEPTHPLSVELHALLAITHVKQRRYEAATSTLQQLGHLPPVT